MPVVLSLALVGFIAQLIYSPRPRRCSTRCSATPDQPIDWLGDPTINIWAVLVAAVWRHTGYVMILYLAGLKARRPGAEGGGGASTAPTSGRRSSGWSSRRCGRSTSSSLVITVIEALRAFDIVYAINTRPQRPGAAVRAGHPEHRRRGQPDRLRLRDRGDPAGDLARASSSTYLSQIFREEQSDDRRRRTVAAPPAHRAGVAAAGGRPAGADPAPRVPDRGGAGLAAPAAAARSTRRCARTQETAEYGYFSLAAQAVAATTTSRRGARPTCRTTSCNTLIIAVPGGAADAVPRLVRGVRAGPVHDAAVATSLLILFTAGNLLPQQVHGHPAVHGSTRKIPLPEWMSRLADAPTTRTSGVIADPRRVPDRVLRLRALQLHADASPRSSPRPPRSTGPACGAQYWQIILPLCRPALAALATLEFTWIYNDFLWALVLIADGDKLPITCALNNLRGQFFTDYNLLAAGSVIVALPTLIVFLLLQRQFISGLTLGANNDRRLTRDSTG